MVSIETHRWSVKEAAGMIPMTVSRGTAAVVHTSLWTKPPPPQQPGDPPPLTSRSKKEEDDRKHYVFVFGGCTGIDLIPTNQMSIYDLDTSLWLDQLPTAEEQLETIKKSNKKQKHLWKKLKSSVRSAGVFKAAGEEHAKRLRGIESRTPLPRHSHAMIKSRDQKRLFVFGGEGVSGSVSDPVYRAKSSLESKRMNNAKAAGAPRYHNKRPVSPVGRIRYENPRVVRTFFSDLQVYVIASNVWVDVKRQLPGKFGFVDGNDQSLWPNHRAGHSMTLMGTPIVLELDEIKEDEELLDPKKSKNNGPDPHVGLSLPEVATCDSIRSPEGGLLILWGGREAPPRERLRKKRSSPNSQDIEVEQGRSIMADTLWSFDLNAMVWRQFFASGLSPPPTEHHKAVTSKDGNSMFVYGGKDDLGNIIGALHELKRTKEIKRNKKGKSEKKKEEASKQIRKQSDATAADEVAKEAAAAKAAEAPPPDDYVWTWVRIQLLPTPGSPPPAAFAQIVLHPVQYKNTILIFGGQAELTESFPFVSTDFAFRFNTATRKWDGTTLLTNGPSQSIGGHLVSSLDTGRLWHFGGKDSNTSNCFVSKLLKSEINSGASAKLNFTIVLKDPMSEGRMELPPIMGAISEEKQVLLLSLKSERDSHAKDLQKYCKKPSRRDWKKTKSTITQIRKSRRGMLNASNSMSDIIYTSHPKEDEDEDENAEIVHNEKRETMNEDNTPQFNASFDSDVSSAQRIQTQGNPRSRQHLQEQQRRTMQRSQTAPVLEHTAPFISMSSSRQYFNYSVMGMKTPRWSKNTLLSPVKAIYQDAEDHREEEEGEIILAGRLI